MLYKRIVTALCLVTFLSIGTIKCSEAVSNVQSMKDSILKMTDRFAGWFYFGGQSSDGEIVVGQATKNICKFFLKSSIVLLVLIPFIKYLTDGKKFNNASDDEELAKVVKTVLKDKQITIKSLKSLSKEVMYKLIRVIRSKVGHRSYLITIKEEKTTNEDGSKVTVTELKTVPGTGLCKSFEDLYENMIFLANSSTNLVGLLTFAKLINDGTVLVNGKDVNLKNQSAH